MWKHLGKHEHLSTCNVASFALSYVLAELSEPVLLPWQALMRFRLVKHAVRVI